MKDPLVEFSLYLSDYHRPLISLEKDMIPQWLNEGRNLSVFRDLGRFIDIGTPESYIQFNKEVQFWSSKHY